jgi:hypothetical protein
MPALRPRDEAPGGTPMSGIYQTVLQFASERFLILAENIAVELRKHDASGIYGDDAGEEYDFPIKTLWDEYCYEQAQGPTDGLDRDGR